MSGKQIDAPFPSNGVYGADGKFYANGTTPPKEAGDFDNPRVYQGDEGERGEPEQIVGAPTPEQIAEADELARRQSPVAVPTPGESEGGKSPKPASVAKKAPAKKATAKKAPAKKAAPAS